MIIEAVIKLAVSHIAVPLWQEIVIMGITARIKEEVVTRKIATAIEESLLDALADVPGFEADIEEVSLVDFLSSSTVSTELRKTISPFELPNVILLRDEWLKRSSRASVGNVEILLNAFLIRLRKKLLTVAELRDILYQKESLSSLSNIKSSLDSLESQFTQFTESQFEPVEGKSKEEADLQSKLDTYRDLIKRGFPNSSLVVLQDIEKEIHTKNISNQLRSQLQGLLGFSYYLTGNFTEATKRFENALALTPEDPKALANAALAALVNDKLDVAIKYATQSLEKGGEKTSARAILVNVTAINQKFENLGGLVDDKYLDNTDYVRALANIFHQALNFELAIKYYRLCLAQNPADFYSLLGLASVLIQQAKYAFRYQAISTVDEALKLIEGAIVVAKSGDNEKLLTQAFAARSGLLLARGELQKAKQDCDYVLGKSPDNKLALHNKGIIAFLEGNYDLAINCLSKLPEDYITDERVALPLAEAQIANAKPEKAIETIHKFSQTADAADQYALYVVHAKALIKLNKKSNAQKIKDDLLSETEKLKAMLAASEIAQLEGNYSQAFEILEKTYERFKDDKDQEKELVILMLALLYYHHKDFEKSVNWFNLLPREFLAENELAHKYINALYSTKRYGETHKALQDARKFGVNASSLLELESWLAEYFGDRNLAIELQKQLIGEEPQKINHKVELARLEFLNNQRGIARETLNSIDLNALEDPNSMMLIAEMYSYIGENVKAIQLAYKARKSGIDNPRIHVTYITLFTRIEEEINDLLSTDIVQPDNAILLNSPKDSFWVKLPVITKPTGDWEFSPDSDTGKLLLGHKTGDIIEFKSTPLETLSYKIQEIQTVYVRAFQESFEEFSTRFPKHEGIQKMDVSDGDISKIVIPLYQRSSYVEQVYELYRQGQLPLCTVATMVGSSQLEVFWTFLADKEKRIYASHGSADDQNQQAEALIKANSITLDITGLLTLSHLDLLHMLNKRYDQVFVHQALIDELDTLIISRGFEFKKGARFIGYHDGLPRFEEISPKSIEESIKYLTDLRSFLREKCNVIPVPPELDNQNPLPDEIRQSIGRLSLSTALVAKHTKTPLYADDAVIRGIAKQALEVSGAWSQIVLKNAADRGIITADEYVEACAKLSKANYFFVAINKHLIIFSLEKSTYMASDERTKLILDGLKGPDTNEDDAINIATEVLKKIWLSTITVDQKRFILDAILRSLYAGRSNDIVTIKLLRALEIALGGAKDAIRDIASQIRLFYAVINKIH